jgi:hypothetical protein
MEMQFRTVEALRDNRWILVEMYQLKQYEYFRMFNPDGSIVVGDNGKTVFYSISEPYWSDTYDTWTIDIGEKLH